MNTNTSTHELLGIEAALAARHACEPTPEETPPDSFLQRMRVEASRAAEVRKLSVCAEDIPLQAVSLSDYLGMLAQRAHVMLSRVLPASQDANPLAPLLRLAQEILVPWTRLQLMVRTHIASHLAPVPAALHRGAITAPTRHPWEDAATEEDWDAALRAFEARYSDAARARLADALEQLGGKP